MEKNTFAFMFICKINSLIIEGYIKIKLFLERLNKKDKINVYLTFYSELKDVSYNYQLQMSKPMIENKMLKILYSYPNLVKSMTTRWYNPLTGHIIVKYWGEVINSGNGPIIILKHFWHNQEPAQPSEEKSKLLHEKY